MAGVTAARRSALTVLSGLLLGLAGVLTVASPASAHAILVSSDPAANSIVPAAPSQVVLTFTEPVTLIPGKIEVVAPDGSRADENQPSTSGDKVIIPLKPNGIKGTYLVNYRVISADSHPVAQSIIYSVVTQSTPPTGDATVTNTSAAVSVLFPVVRFLGYAGLVLLTGAVLVLATLWPQRLSRDGAMRVLWAGAGLIALSTVLEFVVEVADVAGGFGSIAVADWQQVISSQFGGAHLLRLGVLVAALFLVRAVLSGRGWGADRILLAVLGVVGVGTWSVSGHPSASSQPVLTTAVDMIHIASMSIWVGGLVMLALFLLPRARASELAAIVPVWSRWATWAVGALALTGVIQAVVEVGAIRPLYTTTYGWLVLVKAGLFGLVLLIGLSSHRLVGAIEERAKGAATRLRTLVAAEALGAAVVIGVASVLVQTTPARPVPGSEQLPSVQSAVLKASLFTLTVDEQATGEGAAHELHMYATTPSGSPASVKQWTVTAALPSKGIAPITASVLGITADHAIAEVSLPATGAWVFSFTLRTTDIDEATVTTDFTVE
jgi:copper transport protein